MIHVELQPDKGILIITPQGALSADDFHRIAAVADPYVERSVARHLAQPDIRQFPQDQEVRALAWLETGK